MNVSLIGSIDKGTFSIESNDFSEVYGSCKVETRTLYGEDKTTFFYGKRLTYVTALQIAPEYRGKKIASEAMKEILIQLKELDTEGAYLTASVKGKSIPMEKLVELYKKAGFTVYKEHFDNNEKIIFCDMHILY